MTDLHVTTWGDGEPVLFVHGSFVRGGASWAGQRPLADRYRLLFVDRRGYGDSPAAGGEDFDRDADDIADLLGDGVHLVGHSYGGVVSLLAAAMRPDAIRSLTVIEPPAFQLAPDSPAARAMRERIGAIFERAGDLAPDAFYPAFLQAMGYDLETLRLRAWSDLGPGSRSLGAASLDASIRQRMPWEARIDLPAIARASFPKLVISGGWDTASAATRATAGAGLLAVCDVLAERIGARRAVIAGAFHSPQSARPAAFNACLATFLDSVPRIPGQPAPAQ